jgi:hypothetical protein
MIYDKGVLGSVGQGETGGTQDNSPKRGQDPVGDRQSEDPARFRPEKVLFRI